MPRWKRIARPRGEAEVSVSGTEGRPVEEERRARIGVDGVEPVVLKWGALESWEARGVGVKWPVRRIPLAWAE